jgi:ECF transporter S component (folate family)
VLGSLLLAMLVVLERLVSIQTPVLRVSLSYVPIILSAILLGPAWSTAVAVLGDLLGMLLFPKSAFFIGYTLSAALTGLIYGLFLHRPGTPKQFLLRLIISNLMVLVFVSVGLTSLWIVITLRRAFFALLPFRLLSAAIKFPIETGTMFALKLFMDRNLGKYLYDDADRLDNPVLPEGAEYGAGRGGGAAGGGTGIETNPQKNG